MTKTLGNIIGGWAFLIGVILAIIIGLFNQLNTSTPLMILAVIGILVGLFNIAGRETTPFLLSGVVLVIVSNMGLVMMKDIPFLANILGALMVIFVPATVIVAIKNVFNLAKA